MSVPHVRVRLVVRGKAALDAYMLAFYIKHDKPSGVTLARCADELATMILSGEVFRTEDPNDQVR